MDPPELLEDHSRLAGCLFSGTSGESTQSDLVGQFATCGSEEEVTFSVAPRVNQLGSHDEKAL